MKVTSSAIENGHYADKYGKRGSQFSPNGMPTYSIPFEITDAPADTKSFAVVLEDKDAISAAGCSRPQILRNITVKSEKSEILAVSHFKRLKIAKFEK